MKFFALLLTSTFLLWSWSLPRETRQLIVVVSNDWRASSATLYRLEKKGSAWKRVGAAVAVKVGKSGMGWGRGLFTAPKKGEPLKREGDGRAPAGVFRLPFLFGEGKSRFSYPYRRMGDFHRCVDDRRSKYYNRIIDSRKVQKDYRSYERMKFPSGLYRYGIFVDHNPNRVPGAGSCIFLHIRKASGAPTVGCTAMGVKELLQIMRWLDPAKAPLLIQAPRRVIGRLLPDNLQLTLLR